MSYRCERIIIPWLADFGGHGQMTLDLTIDDQNDPRLLAIIAWWKERHDAIARAEGPADPSLLA